MGAAGASGAAASGAAASGASKGGQTATGLGSGVITTTDSSGNTIVSTVSLQCQSLRPLPADELFQDERHGHRDFWNDCYDWGI